MFEDLESETKAVEVEEEPHWWIGPWAHVIAIAVFCLLYFPFRDRPWSWQVAITGSYIVFMLCCTCGLAFKDADDLFGDSQVPRYVATLLTRQIVVLVLVSFGAYLWTYLRHILPSWATQEGRRMSVWDYCGIVLFYIVAVREALWMAGKIKRQFPELEDVNGSAPRG